jgi:hypothetical protein
LAGPFYSYFSDCALQGGPAESCGQILKGDVLIQVLCAVKPCESFFTRPYTRGGPSGILISLQRCVNESDYFVLQVSGVTISSKSLSDIRKRMTGPPGTEVDAPQRSTYPSSPGPLC